MFCDNEKVIVSYPTIARTCKAHATPITHRLIELTAVGMPQYRLLLYVPRFPEINTDSIDDIPLGNISPWSKFSLRPVLSENQGRTAVSSNAKSFE